MAKICDGNPFYENFSSAIEDSGTDAIGTLQKAESPWVEQIKVEGGVKMNTPAGADFLLCYASAEGKPLNLILNPNYREKIVFQSIE